MPPHSPAPRCHQLAAHRGVLGFLVRDGDAVRNRKKRKVDAAQLAAHRGVLGFLVRDGDAVRNRKKRKVDAA